MKRQVSLIVGTLGCFLLFAGCSGDDDTSWGPPAGTGGSGEAGSSGSKGGASGGGAAGSSTGGTRSGGSNSGGSSGGGASNSGGSNGAGTGNGGSSSTGASAGGAGRDSGGATQGGAAGSSGSVGVAGAAGGADTGCPVGCHAPDNANACPPSQVYWTCFGTSADPMPSQQVLREFENGCTSNQTPRPTFCCPKDFHSGC